MHRFRSSILFLSVVGISLKCDDEFLFLSAQPLRYEYECELPVPFVTRDRLVPLSWSWRPSTCSWWSTRPSPPTAKSTLATTSPRCLWSRAPQAAPSRPRRPWTLLASSSWTWISEEMCGSHRTAPSPGAGGVWAGGTGCRRAAGWPQSGRPLLPLSQRSSAEQDPYFWSFSEKSLTAGSG